MLLYFEKPDVFIIYVWQLVRACVCQQQQLSMASSPWHPFFTEVKGEAVGLVCGAQVAMFKDYNLKRYYVTKQEEKYENLSDEERAKELDASLAKV